MRWVCEMGSRELSGKVVPNFPNDLVWAVFTICGYQEADKTVSAGKRCIFFFFIKKQIISIWIPTHGSHVLLAFNRLCYMQEAN